MWFINWHYITLQCSPTASWVDFRGPKWRRRTKEDIRIERKGGGNGRKRNLKGLNPHDVPDEFMPTTLHVFTVATSLYGKGCCPVSLRQYVAVELQLIICSQWVSSTQGSGLTNGGRGEQLSQKEGKTNLDLLEQETVSGSSISWAICKSASRSRQITMPTSHHSVFTGLMCFLLPNQQPQSTE